MVKKEIFFTTKTIRSSSTYRWILYLIPLHIAFLCLFSQIVTSSSLYPVSNLDASLAASCAQGTVTAIRSSDGIILFTMSPKDMTWNSTISQSKNNSSTFLKDDSMGTKDEVCLIPILTRGFTCSPLLKILQARHGLVISVTGFRSDCDYFARYAAGAVSEHEFIYGGEPLECQAIVRESLSPLLRDATMGNGNRPLGIQAMVIGAGKVVDHGEQTIATLDPSGNIRYWNRHAVIGKQAAIIKKYLELYSKDDKCDDTLQMLPWQDALELGLSTIVEAMKESENLDETSLDNFETNLDCFVLFKRCSPSFGKCATVSRPWISQTFRKIYYNKTKYKT